MLNWNVELKRLSLARWKKPALRTQDGVATLDAPKYFHLLNVDFCLWNVKLSHLKNAPKHNMIL